MGNFRAFQREMLKGKRQRQKKAERRLFKAFMKNDYDRQYFENAPSETAREYIYYIFIQDVLPAEEFVSETALLEPKLGLRDNRYILQMYIGTPGYTRFKKRIRELEEEEKTEEGDLL